MQSFIPGNSETMSHENLREDLPERPTAPILYPHEHCS